MSEYEKRSANDLTRAVVRLAGYPTAENRDLFYTELLHSKVAIRLKPEQESVPSGNYVTAESNQIAIPTTHTPDGSAMLLVMADARELLTRYPNDSFAEVDGRVVLQMALQKHTGVIVTTDDSDANASWAGVTAIHVPSILAEQHPTQF